MLVGPSGLSHKSSLDGPSCQPSSMADVVFGAVEVAVCITEVVKLLYNYINGVKDAKDDIRKLTQELFALKGALEHFSLHDEMGIDKTM